jgi:hypothetical protein
MSASEDSILDGDSFFYPEDGGSMFLLNVIVWATYLPDYTE